ncbi:MAG TPA: conjugal transfer protein TrbD [Desulfobulbaceae bacterium]|nr:conjugal transfer protein TrbD [Desulfobulbaceae bacterium]
MAIEDEPRSVPIRQSLLRPELVLGGEREPVMSSALFAILVGTSGAASGQFLTVGLALAFYFAAVVLFRRMAKADPAMTKTWRRHIAYRNFYPSGSPYWSLKGYRKQ